jgi:hypothetical protein
MLGMIDECPSGSGAEGDKIVLLMVLKMRGKKKGNG